MYGYNFKYSLRAKILTGFILLVMFFSVISATGLTLSLRAVYSLAEDRERISLRHINLEISSLVKSIQARALVIAGNTELQQVLRKELPENMKEIYSDRLHFNHKLYYECIQLNNVDGIYIIGTNGAMFHATYSFRENEYRNKKWFQDVINQRKMIWLEPRAGSELGNNLDFLTMSIATPIFDRASTKVLGVIIIEVLLNNIRKLIFEDFAYEGTFSIINENNKVIYTNNVSEVFIDSLGHALEKLPERIKYEGKAFLNIQNKKYIAVFSNLSDSNWNLLCMSLADEIFLPVIKLANILFVTGIIILIICIILSFVVSSRIVKPVRTMQEAMKKVEAGNLSVRVDETVLDEVGDMQRGFNHMLETIKNLMVQEREAQENLKRADFNALQAQINPHFLYNTLDSINWMVRMNHTDKVENMIDNLTSFIRIGLSRGRTFITLRDELKHVESYFLIQKERYSSLLSYKIEVAENLFDYQVIKMILQPLVENSLYHGIKERDEPGTIIIKGYEEDSKLILTVEDNGLGMTQQRLNEVREMMKSGESKNKDAYGIINVQRRIKSYFGEEYGISFDSVYNIGTIATIIIPVRRMETEIV